MGQRKERRGAELGKGRDEGIQGIRKCCLRAAKGEARSRAGKGTGRGKKIGQCCHGAVKGEARSRAGEMEEGNAAVGQRKERARGEGERRDGQGTRRRKGIRKCCRPCGSQRKGAAQGERRDGTKEFRG